MRFRKIWWGSWWWLGELCEAQKCLLWRGPLSYVQCFLYLVSSSINVFIFHSIWLDVFWKDIYIFWWIYKLYIFHDYLFIHLFIPSPEGIFICFLRRRGRERQKHQCESSTNWLPSYAPRLGICLGSRYNTCLDQACAKAQIRDDPTDWECALTIHRTRNPSVTEKHSNHCSTPARATWLFIKNYWAFLLLEFKC